MMVEGSLFPVVYVICVCGVILVIPLSFLCFMEILERIRWHIRKW